MVFPIARSVIVNYLHGICDVVKLRENGINVGLGTDGIANTTTMDMFEKMKAYLQNANLMEPTNIIAYDILKMATIEAAKVLGLDKEIGTLEVGKKADMIFLKIDKLHTCQTNDICENIVFSLNGADVENVIIDGKLIMQNRKMLNLNEKEAINQVKKIDKRLL